jgi:hypothetical protein
MGKALNVIFWTLGAIAVGALLAGIAAWLGGMLAIVAGILLPTSLFSTGWWIIVGLSAIAGFIIGFGGVLSWASEGGSFNVTITGDETKGESSETGSSSTRRDGHAVGPE